jgi:hypothetical protein
MKNRTWVPPMLSKISGGSNVPGAIFSEAAFAAGGMRIARKFHGLIGK